MRPVIVGLAGTIHFSAMQRARNAMTTIHRALTVLLLACALTACNRQGPELPTAVQSENGRADDGSGIDTVVVSSDGAFVGSSIDERGEILALQHDFAPDATVYVSAPSKGRRLGDRVEVFWFHQDGLSRKDEAKKITGPFTAFEFQPTETGKYNVEVDVNNRPIALVEFEVK
ncbi:MAG: hypothetical protein ABIQ62_05415 [Thermomonas sp.]